MSPSATPRAAGLVPRLVVSFLIPTLLVLAGIAAVAYSRAIRAVEGAVIRQLEAVAQVKEAALVAWIDHLYEDVLQVAAMPEIGRLAGRLLAPDQPAERHQAARGELAERLGQVRALQPNILELMLLSAADGRVAVSTRAEHEGQYRTYDPYYLEGRQRPHIQNVYPSAETLRPTLTISVPLGGDGGEVFALVAAHLSLTYLDLTTLGRTGLGPSGRVLLVDRYKLPVTGSTYGNAPRDRGLRSLAIDEVVRRRTGRGSYLNPAGVEVLGVYRWIDQRELGLVVEIDRREALTPARRLATTLAGAAAVVLPLLVGGTFLVARRIAAPIRELTTASQRVAGGDLSSTARVRSDDEIGVLAANFNRMVARLDQLYREMQEKIVRLERSELERGRLIDELEAQNEELQRFSYTVSHDLKSPLVTIRGFVGMMRQDLEAGKPERVAADLDRIAHAAETMAELLDQLLELSRVGRLVGPTEVLSVAQLASEAVTTVTGRQNRIGAEIHLAPDLPEVAGDRVRLREVFENLLDNALKFMGDQPAPRVEVGARPAVDGQAVLTVRDNGIGIQPRYHDKIFGLFDRLDPAVEGTGIGLALVRRIVETHGGRIWVESDGGNGSCFCFTLPLSDGVAGPAAGRSPSQRSAVGA